MVDLSKFISSKKILSEVVASDYNSTKFVAKLCIKINMIMYFENLTIGLYVFNIYIKFHVNKMLFTTQ